jgi:hypothetical protein
MHASGVLVDGASLQAFNYNRQRQLDEVEGTCAVSENWVAFVPADGIAATHEQNISQRYDLNGVLTVNVGGSIVGYRTSTATDPTPTATRATAMQNKWTSVSSGIYAAAVSAAGRPIHAAPLSARVQSNAIQGTLTYEYEYNNRPQTFAGSVSERVTIRDTAAPDMYATAPIPGRIVGPVLQDLDTVGVYRRALSIEVMMPAQTQSYTPSQPGTTSYVLAQKPVATQVFLDDDTVEWNAYDGRYSRNVTWTYQ